MRKRLTEAIRNLLRDEQEFIEPDRTQAAKDLRAITHDRIYSGRRDTVDGAWVDMSVVALDPSHSTTKGLTNGSQEFVEIVCHSWDSDEAHDMSAAVSVCLDSLRMDVKTRRGVVQIGSMRLVDRGENDPQKLADASAQWEFMNDLTFAVRYVQDGAAVVALPERDILVELP